MATTELEYNTRIRLNEKDQKKRLEIIKTEGEKNTPLSEINKLVNEALGVKFHLRSTSYWYDKVFAKERLIRLKADTDKMDRWNYSGKYAESEQEESFEESIKYKEPTV